MARRRTRRCWRIGDDVECPWLVHRDGTDVIGGWQRGTVVLVRGDRVVVRVYGHDYEHAAWGVRRVRHVPPGGWWRHKTRTA